MNNLAKSRRSLGKASCNERIINLVTLIHVMNEYDELAMLFKELTIDDTTGKITASRKFKVRFIALNENLQDAMKTAQIAAGLLLELTLDCKRDDIQEIFMEKHDDVRIKSDNAVNILRDFSQNQRFDPQTHHNVTHVQSFFASHIMKRVPGRASVHSRL